MGVTGKISERLRFGRVHSERVYSKIGRLRLTADIQRMRLVFILFFCVSYCFFLCYPVQYSRTKVCGKQDVRLRLIASIITGKFAMRRNTAMCC